MNISWNFLGQKIGVKNLLEKNKKNMDMKVLNQTTAILAELNNFKRK